MLLIPVVVFVIGGILALVLYLEKRSPPDRRVGPLIKGPTQSPNHAGPKGAPFLRGLSSGAPGSSLGCAAGQKVGYTAERKALRVWSPPVGRLRGA